jgi:hypothetical protein
MGPKTAIAIAMATGRHFLGGSLCAQLLALAGIPTQVVVPSVSWAVVLQGFAGTISVEVPSAEVLARPVDELAGCSATP